MYEFWVGENCRPYWAGVLSNKANNAELQKPSVRAEPTIPSSELILKMTNNDTIEINKPDIVNIISFYDDQV